MLKYKLIFVAVTCLFSVNVFAQPNEIPVRMKLYYTDFDAKTYGAISKKGIEESAGYNIWFYGNHKFINTIQKQLESHKSQNTLHDDVRLKVVIFQGGKTKTYYVDTKGTVENATTNENFKLLETELENLHEEIIQYKGVVDQHPQFDLWGIH